ncbi:MAG TPA: TatD family hydrolase [Candidatus Binatia bacterium]
MSAPHPLPPGVRVVDSHCHLADEAFDADRDAVWQRALDVGVAGAVIVGAGGGSASNQAALELVRRHPDRMRAVVGIHPHDAKDADRRALEEVARLARDPLVAAVGETGLDYHYDNSPREAQVASLRAHVLIAAEVGKPLVIHCRDAYADLFRVLDEDRPPRLRGVVHCFTGNLQEAQAMLELGFSISFSGIVTFRNANALREVARVIPRDRLLVETDAPYLAPVPLRGKRCEPSFVVETAARLAEVRGDDLAELCAAVTHNATAIFGLPATH